ncbi:MAG TPA: SpoIID/LytB domain-containing protein [Solirubrobacteraceae bacterium]|nr:SpoIID/LytB domain-containing protein [Solirubrobacteraceae bacterium]
MSKLAVVRRLAVLACLLGALVGAPCALGAGTLFIRGGGYGHGIGMSQYGALGYALHGKDYRYILGHYYTGTQLAQTDPMQVVRVLLRTGSASFSGATQAAGAGAKPVVKPLHAGSTYAVRALANGSLVLLDPAGKKLGTFAAPLTVTGPTPLALAGMGAYRGSLEFRPDGSGGVQTVDALALDDYVRGVIGLEMSASWPAQALEAQAVAARTYAITTSVSGNGYTLYPDTRSQMYGGVSAESAATDAAVAATRGQIVTYGGAPAVTYFFSSSGGYTENIENVWIGATPEPWLRGVPDPYDGAGGNPYHRWAYNLTPGTAAHDLGGLLKGSLVGIRITKHGVSPRILLAQVVGTKGTTSVTGGQLQSAFRLLTTYASFTLVTTSPGLPSPHSARDVMRRGMAPSAAVFRLMATLSRAARAVHGSVFPGHRGQVVAVQQLVHGAWQTVAQPRLAANGAYATRVRAAGQYRVVVSGLNGPAVTVG